MICDFIRRNPYVEGAEELDINVEHFFIDKSGVEHKEIYHSLKFKNPNYKEQRKGSLKVKFLYRPDGTEYADGETSFGSAVGQVQYANGEVKRYDNPAAYLACIKEKIEYRNTTGFRFDTLTENPEVRKAVDDIIYDIYGEKNPYDIEHYKYFVG